MRPPHNGPDFFSTLAQPRSLRLFPRDTTSHGLRHSTIIIIAVSASVGSFLLAILFWRILLRSSERSRSAPLPPRQALVHERERQLVAFTVHNNASVPKILTDDDSNAASYEADERTEAALPSFVDKLHPPTPPFFTPSIPTSESSMSVPSSYDRSSPSPDGARPRTANSPSMSTLSAKRSADRPGSSRRPHSMVSIGTTQTIMSVRSRTSMRCAPHAPHSNVQIVLPAPLAPTLYERPASAEPRLGRPSGVRSTYNDSWRSSLVDTWVSASQSGTSESEHTEQQRSRDSMERWSQLTRRGPSPTTPVRRRSQSNPSPLPHTSELGPSQDTRPPVPRVPSKYGVHSRQHDGAPSNAGEHRTSWNPPSSFIGPRKLRS